MTVMDVIERFIEKTGVYTNKCEFIREACRSDLQELDDTAIAALRLEQLLAQPEDSQQSDATIENELGAFAEKVDPDGFEQAVEWRHEETADRVYRTA